MLWKDDVGVQEVVLGEGGGQWEKVEGQSEQPSTGKETHPEAKENEYWQHQGQSSDARNRKQNTSKWEAQHDVLESRES